MKNTLTFATIILALLFSPSLSAQNIEEEIQRIAHSQERPTEVLPEEVYFFQFLPELAKKLNTSSAQIILPNSVPTHAMLEEIGFLAPFENDEIMCTTVVDGDTEYYVWQYPAPDKFPLPLYIAFAPCGDHLQIFYLEKSIMIPWTISSSEDTPNYLGYGQSTSPASARDFVILLKHHGLLAQN